MEAQFGALAFAIFVAAQFVAVIAADNARPEDPPGLAPLARPVEPFGRPRCADGARRGIAVAAAHLP